MSKIYLQIKHPSSKVQFILHYTVHTFYLVYSPSYKKYGKKIKIKITFMICENYSIKISTTIIFSFWQHNHTHLFQFFFCLWCLFVCCNDRAEQLLQTSCAFIYLLANLLQENFGETVQESISLDLLTGNKTNAYEIQCLSSCLVKLKKEISLSLTLTEVIRIEKKLKLQLQISIFAFVGS